ncbi:hypothetical protein RJ639_043310 [Escallonia herrerae]|uniref:DUF7875 domain-containing protein n=1 Tax=Escallonia herrerae TaxID=1293975 RepID=A0AA88WCA2_9ASTE|nr:hypothetical protein RJ639_043310 [Escallonia herrerae]
MPRPSLIVVYDQSSMIMSRSSLTVVVGNQNTDQRESYQDPHSLWLLELNPGLPGTGITVPRSLRWAACGAVSVGSTTALLRRTTVLASKTQAQCVWMDKNLTSEKPDIFSST